VNKLSCAQTAEYYSVLLSPKRDEYMPFAMGYVSTNLGRPSPSPLTLAVTGL